MVGQTYYGWLGLYAIYKGGASALSFFAFGAIAMAERVKGTLSTLGWARTPESRMDRVLTDYLSANPSQTIFYRGNVNSLQSDIFSCGGNIDQLIQYIKRSLGAAYSRQFPENSTVEVTYTPDTIRPDKVDIHISVLVYENGVAYDLSRVINAIDSVFVSSQNAVELVKN